MPVLGSNKFCHSGFIVAIVNSTVRGANKLSRSPSTEAGQCSRRGLIRLREVVDRRSDQETVVDVLTFTENDQFRAVRIAGLHRAVDLRQTSPPRVSHCFVPRRSNSSRNGSAPDEVSMMLSKADISEALDLGEDDDFEFKDGRGGIGKSFMETVSAFSNTLGGTIICGIKSLDGDSRHEVVGLKDAKKYKESLWNSLHEKSRISHCSCRRMDIAAHTIEGKSIVSVHIRLADRRRRPVYTGDNVFKGTFKRRNSSDYRCDDAEVRQMIRDATADPQDRAIQSNTTINDVDTATLQAFRNKFSSRTT